jgi:hypothetical protein
MLALYETEFSRRSKLFMPPTLYFGDSPPSAVEPPPLSYSLNRQFIDHSNWLLYSLKALDDVETSDSRQQARKEALAMAIEEHINFLETEMQHAWDRYRKVDPSVPRYVDCGKNILYFSAGVLLTSILFDFQSCLYAAVPSF